MCSTRPADLLGVGVTTNEPFVEASVFLRLSGTAAGGRCSRHPHHAELGLTFVDRLDRASIL